MSKDYKTLDEALADLTNIGALDTPSDNGSLFNTSSLPIKSKKNGYKLDRPRATFEPIPIEIAPKFKILFENMHQSLKDGKSKIQEIDILEKLNKGDIFILRGVALYIYDVGEFFKQDNGQNNAYVTIIYESGVMTRNFKYRSLITELRYTKERTYQVKYSF